MRSAVVFLQCLVVVNVFTVTRSECPWEDRELKNWSDGSSWPSGNVPGENEDVVIPADTKMVLDISPPRLQTLTIDGVLVWGNVDNIRVETRFIKVNGEFHIGAEDCRFEKTADIFLYGLLNTTVGLDDDCGVKFICASYGSLLEIHGQEKKSWTKLVETIGPNNGSCGHVYNSQAELFDKENQEGLHAVLWNPDGTVFDYDVSATESGRQDDVDEFVYWLRNISYFGKVLAIAVRKDIGEPQDYWESLYQAMEDLGSTQIRNVNKYDAYSFITVIGHPDHTSEMHVAREEGDTTLLTASVDFTMNARSLTFSVESATIPDSNNFYRIFQVSTMSVATPLLSVLDDVSSWKPGDQVVVTSTDYDWNQAELKTIVECLECSNYQLKVNGFFEYEHYGRVSHGVDMRAEVGLLSRNIRVEGEVQKQCYYETDHDKWLCDRYEKDTFGAHIRILRGATAHVEGIQTYHMGQQRDKGNYPFHWHMCDEVPGQYFKNSVVHDSFSRCTTIHGTDNATVEDIVCYKHLGHGIFMEDSAERWNTIHHNLILGSQHGTLLLSDMKESDCDEDSTICNLLTSFWITRPENFVTDNVAAGGDGNGYALTFADVPLGMSFDRQKERGLWSNGTAQYTKVELFRGNSAHSNGDNGLWFDSRISYGQVFDGEYIEEDGIIRMNALYAPINNETGEYETTEFSQLTFYRNDDFDAWIRCGNVMITNSSFADTMVNLASAHTTGETACSVHHSIFIGQSENKGLPFTYRNKSDIYDDLPDDQVPMHYFDYSMTDNNPDNQKAGIWMYQGPIFVYNCYFDKFYNSYFNDSFIDLFGYRPVKIAGALSFHKQNNYPLVPRSGVGSLKWGFCDGENDAWRVFNGNSSIPYWVIEDGTDLVNYHDYDGSLTGTPDVQLVPRYPFFTGPECLDKPEWNVKICPYNYTQIIIKGQGGVLSDKYKKSWPLHVSRDDEPKSVITLQGVNHLKYPMRVNKSYTIKFNTTLADVPDEVTVKAKFGLTNNDVIRFAICYPKSVTSFKIESSVPVIDSEKNMPVWVDSLAELDADQTMTAFFWDDSTGYLYFKLSSNESFDRLLQEYPGDSYRQVVVTKLDGDDRPTDCDDYENPPYSNSFKTDPLPVQPGVCNGPDSMEGIGAPVRKEVFPHTNKHESCPYFDDIYIGRPSEKRGCFFESSLLQDFDDATITLQKSLTPSFCANRCLQRGYPYAGMYSGSTCGCSKTIGINGELGLNGNCDKVCTGDQSQFCGGSSEEGYFYTTGADLFAPPDRCGPMGRGEVYEDKCLYVNYMEMEFWAANDMCGLLGGELVRIDTEEKMRAIALYLRNVDYDVWFGGKGTDDAWYNLDDSPIEYFNWRNDPVEPEESRFLYMQEYRRYKWDKSPYYRNKMSLCEFDPDADSEFTFTDSTDKGDCGYNLMGHKYGQSGTCFTRVVVEITYATAQVSCMKMFGRLGSVLNATEKADIEGFLNSEDDGYRYWVSGNPSEEGYQKLYDEDIERSLIEKEEDDSYRAVCVLDQEDIDGCPPAWTRGGDTCYLDTNITTVSYFQAAGICNSGHISIMTTDTEEAVEAVRNFTSGFAWTDIRYYSPTDEFVLTNGDVPKSKKYANPDLLQNLSDGTCIVADLDSDTWHQVPCRDGETEYKVICQMPLVYFDKVAGCLY